MRRVILLGLLCLAAAPQQQPDLGVMPVFPSDNPWNWDVSTFAVHPGSAAYIAAIGASTPIREDYSFPYSVVLDAQPNATVTFDIDPEPSYPGESDPGPGFGSPVGGAAQGSYPFPPGAPREGNGVGDAHCLVIDKDNGLLYETYATRTDNPWTAACGAVWNLNSNAVRTESWTSSDAAGLPIFPGLIRYEEIAAGEIKHALRFTCSPTQNRHIYPARHHAGQANTALPPMGLRVRLKASKDISAYTGAARVVLNALKKHGLILADNGSDWYISTTLDDRWGSTNITQIRDMRGEDFEVVVSVNPAGGPILTVTGGGTGPVPPPDPPPLGGGGGGGGGGGCGCTGLELVFLLAFVRRVRPRA